MVLYCFIEYKTTSHFMTILSRKMAPIWRKYTQESIYLPEHIYIFSVQLSP